MRILAAALTTLAFILVCSSSGVGMTSGEAVQMALAAQDTINSIASNIFQLVDPLVPPTGTTTIDGITYTIYEYTNPETGVTLKVMRDQDNKLAKIDYFDPVSRTALTREYDENGIPVSSTLLTTDENGIPLMGITVTASGGGCSTYTMLDYTSTENNMATAEICDNTDPVVTIETCSNTGQSEITYPST